MRHCILVWKGKTVSGFEGLGKILIIVGVAIAVFGLLLAFGVRIPWLGKLPGDIAIRKDSISFYFPVVSFLLLSILLTVIINVVLRLFR